MHYISIKYRRFGQRLAGGLGVRIEGKASANVEIYDAFSGEERGMVGYRRDRETGRK
jgi:hypothetical protein